MVSIFVFIKCPNNFFWAQVLGLTKKFGATPPVSTSLGEQQPNRHVPGLTGLRRINSKLRRNSLASSRRVVEDMQKKMQENGAEEDEKMQRNSRAHWSVCPFQHRKSYKPTRVLKRHTSAGGSQGVSATQVECVNRHGSKWPSAHFGRIPTADIVHNSKLRGRSQSQYSAVFNLTTLWRIPGPKRRWTSANKNSAVGPERWLVVRKAVADQAVASTQDKFAAGFIAARAT